MKRILPLILLTLLFIIPLSASAQESDETLILSFGKDFGFSAVGRIQGTFSMRVRQPEDLVRVEFLIDGEVVNTDSETPFRFQFNTASYAPGSHTFSAVGYKADGTSLSSSQLSRVFLTSEEAWSDTGSFTVPLVIGIIVLTVLGTLGPALIGRKRVFRPGEYGSAGGALCVRCTFPFSRSVLAPNLLVGKLERCPHCGKWAIVRRASSPELEAAEARWSQESQGTIESQSEEQRLRGMLDESRFED